MDHLIRINSNRSIDPYEVHGISYRSANPYPFMKGQNEKNVKLLGIPTISLGVRGCAPTLSIDSQYHIINNKEINLYL